jgi:hypothetical protein
MHIPARRRLVAVGVLTAAAVAIAATLAIVRGPSTPQAAPVAGDMPSALQRHLATMPGNWGMSDEGPGGAADWAFASRAFPADTISVAQMDTARTSFSTMSKRPFKGARGQPGVWMSIGPSKALYPLEDFRNATNYVPNEYVAGGRTTSLALNEARCTNSDCVMYITPAGGGVWRTSKARQGNSNWQYLGGPLGINAAGAVTIDASDASGNTVYVGTGEANICASGCVAGTGLYKSTNGGQTWSGPIGKPEFQGKGIGKILVKPGDPNTLYVATTTALRGMSSSCCSGVTRPVPGIMKWGLYKSTNGGATWSFIHNGSASTAACTGDLTEFTNGGVCSPRGVRDVAFDPSNPDILYATSYARGVWRSNDAGATWTQIKPSLNAAVIQTRPAIAVTTLPNGKTRMYVHEGNNGTNASQFYRSDDVSTGAPVFTQLSNSSIATPGYAFYNLCTGQCWYDLGVYTPKGFPDVVYALGSYSYGQQFTNKRAVVLSTDAGATGTDMTYDATDTLHPNGLHPDQHFLVTVPGAPFEFFESNDGGVMRSNGAFKDMSADCDNRGLTNADQIARCKQMLSRVPARLESMNNGLRTLQFQSLSVSPHNIDLLQGGTQDNGTWENRGPVVWENTMIGDGGQSGFDVAIPEFRFHTFTGGSPDVNYDSGDFEKWIWAGDTLGQTAEFYAPIVSDPVVSKTMYAGTQSVYRENQGGLGARTYAEAQANCNEWTGSFSYADGKGPCGNWQRLGPTALTSAALGDRAGGNMAAVERTKADTSTVWAATSTGRVFVSKNADLAAAASVTWTRIDDDAVTPNRYVSSIYVDPANGNHAWISYSGYDSNTPATPGHAFEVTYNPATSTSTWANRSYDWGDLPMTDLVVDSNGDLYAASDFGVSRLVAGTTSWTNSGTGMPNVEVAGLTIIPGSRRLYAASHGLGAWQLKLP